MTTSLWIKLIEIHQQLSKAKADLELYKTAFEKAEKYIDECPCDPDIYPEQLKAWGDYQDVLKQIKEKKGER